MLTELTLKCKNLSDVDFKTVWIFAVSLSFRATKLIICFCCEMFVFILAAFTLYGSSDPITIFFPPMWHRCKQVKAHRFWQSQIGFRPYSYVEINLIYVCHGSAPIRWTLSQISTSTLGCFTKYTVQMPISNMVISMLLFSIWSHLHQEDIIRILKWSHVRFFSLFLPFKELAVTA